MIRGKDLILCINTDPNNLVPVCHSKSCTLSLDADMLTISNPNSRRESYIPTRTRGSISSDGVMVYEDVVNGISVLEWLQGGNLVYFKFRTSKNGGLIKSGKMYINHWEETGEVTDMVSYSFTAVINGELIIEKHDIIKRVYLADLFGTRLEGCPNPYPVTVLWYDGTIIGLANNPDDVITQFNNYPGNQYYTLSAPDNSCNFTMSIKWNAPQQPDWVPARQGNAIGFWTGQGDGGISPDETNTDLLSPFEYA